MVMGGLACAIALGLGAAVPIVSAGLFAELLGWNLARDVFPGPLALAAVTGFLTVLVFSLPQLGRAAETKAARLFRGVVSTGGPDLDDNDRRGRLRRAFSKGPYLASFVCLALLAALVVVSASDRFLAGLFVVGAFLSFLLLAGAARLLSATLERRRNGESPQGSLSGDLFGGQRLRFALANMTRPGAPLASLMISLGLGLSLLVAVTQVEGNLDLQVRRSLPQEAPSFYFLDLRPDQRAGFEALLAEHEELGPLEMVPMLRGRITKLKGLPVSQYEIPRHIQWVFRSDRGMTWQGPPPKDLEITAGAWWPEDYDGPPLISLDEEVGRAMGLGPGDKMTVNLLGREIEAEIANLRRIVWDDLAINFVLVFSPGMLESAPFGLLATLRAPDAIQDRIESEVAAAFPNVSVIRVKESLESVASLIGRIAIALRAVAWMVLFTVTLVLAGALAAESQRRGRDSVVLKVLGATRLDVMTSLLIEYSILGLFSALLAALIGCLTAYGLLNYLMHLSFTPQPGPLLAATLSALALTLAFGLAETWINLARKAAPVLRNA
jgi:putative ABC transport system permease protein